MGIYKSEKSKKYVGNWRSGDRSGFAVEKYVNGDYYEGMFSENVKHGMGRYLHKGDGSVFTGLFENGLREGFG